MLENLLLKKTKRVRLNLEALKKAVHHEKLMALASSIPSGKDGGPGKAKSLSPSAMTRYLSGERNPALKDALKIAQAVRLDPVELILGYAEDRREKGDSWVNELLSRSQGLSGINLPGVLKHFRHLLRYFHVGYVVEGGPYRFVARTPGGERGFAVLRFMAEKGDLPLSIRVFYGLQVGSELPMVIEFGEVSVTAESVRAADLWTLREESVPRGEHKDFGIRFWVDGPACSFYFIAEKPFAPIDDGLIHVEHHEPEGAVVTFHPSGVHRRPD